MVGHCDKRITSCVWRRPKAISASYPFLNEDAEGVLLTGLGFLVPIWPDTGEWSITESAVAIRYETMPRILYMRQSVA